MFHVGMHPIDTAYHNFFRHSSLRHQLLLRSYAKDMLYDQHYRRKTTLMLKQMTIKEEVVVAQVKITQQKGLLVCTLQYIFNISEKIRST